LKLITQICHRKKNSTIEKEIPQKVYKFCEDGFTSRNLHHASIFRYLIWHTENELMTDKMLSNWLIRGSSFRKSVSMIAQLDNDENWTITVVTLKRE